MDTSNLSQAGAIALSKTNTSEGGSNTWDSEEEPCLGLEGSDLSDYIRDRVECDAADDYLASSDPTTQTSSSYASSSVAS